MDQTLEKAEHALHLDILPHSKLYATVDIGIARLARTRMLEYHPQNPAWNESFKLYCAHATSFVTFSVKNQLPVDAELVGRATVPADRLLQSEVVDEWLDLFDDKGEKLHKASIHVRLRFVDAKKEAGWGGGLSSVPAFTGLPNCYFPQRTGGEVTLYQNAHLSNAFNPKYHRPARYWEDLYDAISDAKHFVYVVGWSVNASITLVRDPDRMIPGAQKVTIGELLKKKADEGVAVLVMLWDDRTSVPLLQNAGIMKTHDQETKKYFDGSKVKCFLCPRKADVDLSAVQKLTTEVQLTHHQKTVTVDAPVAGIGDRRRKVVSFIGGIDISDGRYDNEKHPLFRDLDTLFLNDFQQKNFGNADYEHGGPREPWHDAHSKLDGMAAWDVLTNFEQRWIRQAPKEYADNSLVKIKDNPDVFPLPKTENYSWNTQVFRSIDEASVVGFPFDPSEASRMGLMSGKNVIIDQSIHVGYIEAIRRAKRFIYIENQYFFGSCYAWKESQDCGCLNLVPMEIALKIVSKIRAKERFAVYVVTPMWPEGQPDGDTVQAILHWNHLTMEMMYKMIAEAIDEVGLGGVAHPTDYLNFFCLGNREVQLPGEYVPPKRPEEGTHYWKAQINRRFLIYVHAKLMIGMCIYNTIDFYLYMFVLNVGLALSKCITTVLAFPRTLPRSRIRDVRIVQEFENCTS